MIFHFLPSHLVMCHLVTDGLHISLNLHISLKLQGLKYSDAFIVKKQRKTKKAFVFLLLFQIKVIFLVSCYQNFLVSCYKKAYIFLISTNQYQSIWLLKSDCWNSISIRQIKINDNHLSDRIKNRWKLGFNLRLPI